MIETTVGIFALILGITLMTISSDKAVEHSVTLASALGISPLMIGLILVSLGTDLPEIVNSITSSVLGHGNINIGDSMGSVLTQITLVLGILPFAGKQFKVKRREVLVMGACEILSLILAISIAEKGYISRINAFFLVSSWLIYMLITNMIVGRRSKEHSKLIDAVRGKLYHVVMAALGFIGVTIGAYIVVESVIYLSDVFNIPEYIISFFLVAIGTSLPELAVDLTALRREEYEIAIGDIIGSCIVDASFSVGIGPLLFPQAVSGELASITILYTIFASFMVILTLALRERIDKKAGILFITLYLFSYTILIG